MAAARARDIDFSLRRKDRTPTLEGRSASPASQGASKVAKFPLLHSPGLPKRHSTTPDITPTKRQ